jgi:hypothetical protein
MYILSARSVLVLLICHGRNRAHAASGIWSMMGNWPWSIQPLFQSIWGWKATNHGYPRMTLFSLKFERKNQRVCPCVPVCVCRSVKYRSSPLWFGVPSTLNSFLGSLRHWIGRHKYLVYSRFIKFSVAPKSSRAMALALFDLVCRKVRMVIDLLFDINTFKV